MHWIQLKLSTTKAQAAYWEDALTNQGALAITLADAQDQPLFEPLPGAAPLWDMLQLTGLFNAETDTDSLLIALQHQGETVPPYRIEILEDKDWATAWMDNYQPIAINDRLWICPSWHQPPDPDATNIILDPGLAFGTGSHATTALCLEWLTAAPLAHKTLLDFGCGSGILGVGACLLGCHKVYAIDIDPQALQATRNNAATYQAVSGAGAGGVRELASQTTNLLNSKPLEAGDMPKQIAFNAIPHIDVFQDNGYTREEMKMVWETQKIMEDESIQVNPTCVRIPVFYGHSEAVHIETEKKLTALEAREILSSAPGVKVLDDPANNGYPTAITDGSGTDPVFVGRIREDISHPRGLDLWVVADNVRKGAALNSVQIAELLLEHGM